ncbi:MAG: DUF1801 domain-containing protein [Rubricoccaceae bacterium]|nr:DUF1801 domain-containing protein [Rubricoccaceae bacterium]
MATERPKTVDEYIAAAPPEGQPHLHKLREILKSVAPEAKETMKWNAPFYVEPRYVYSFSAFKAHCNFAPSPTALEAFREELKDHKTTKNYLQIPYKEPVPEDLVRRIAEYRLREVQEREDDSFWGW